MELNTERDVEIFKQDVNKFAQIDRLIKATQDQIKPLQTQLKDLRSQRKEVEQDICSTMGNNDLEQLQSPDNGMVLERQVKRSMIPMTQKTVKEKMIDFFTEGPGAALSFNSKSSEQKGMELFNFIYGKQNRDYKTQEKIKVAPLKEN